MKYLIKNTCIPAFFAVFLLIFSACTGTPADNTAASEDDEEDVNLEELGIILPDPNEPLPVLTFKEIWGYVVEGREEFLTKELPVSDIAYFSASIDSFGKLGAVPKKQKLKYTGTGKVHLTIVCHSVTLLHFTLAPGSNYRKDLLTDIVAASREYDGININFENLSERDGDAYNSFLRDLRAALPSGKTLSVAIPVKVRDSMRTQYDYVKIAAIVDRVFIMAYDEHWSGGRPGSVASLNFCKQVAEYTLRTIPKEKIVMGIPFYGRAWGDYRPSRDYIYKTIMEKIEENNVTDIRRVNGIPFFEYSKNVGIKVYYEDTYSLTARMNMYKEMGIENIGFWRVGQETTEVWDYIKLY
jgi:spore germination protein YaaH